MLKDFVQVAGPLGVTHFVIVSRTEQFINLKVCRLPRGPTLTFHLNAVREKRLVLARAESMSVSFCVQFSLSREVVSSQKKPLSVPHQFLSPPLVSNVAVKKKDTV